MPAFNLIILMLRVQFSGFATALPAVTRTMAHRNREAGPKINFSQLPVPPFFCIIPAENFLGGLICE